MVRLGFGMLGESRVEDFDRGMGIRCAIYEFTDGVR